MIQDTAKLLSISHILKQYPGTMSGGERQRTALARALVLKPKILLMDEPFSALAPVTKQAMYKLIEEIHGIFDCTIDCTILLFVSSRLKIDPCRRCYAAQAGVS